ncbi:MAG TPA: cyclic dehypoxanthinyl futalosine synthase [Dehalococcoidia bacterium]|nr:cyclic dehypoxanthinyl futalosine synthase [Dehalococcoidia bacterium]
MFSAIKAKVRAGGAEGPGEMGTAAGRLTPQEGLYLLREAPLLAIGSLAQEVRFRHNPERAVTFVIDTNLNYSNVCDAFCTFCAFYRREGDGEAYTRSVEEMLEAIGRAAELGTTTVLLQGGLHPSLPLDYYLELVRRTRQLYPRVHPHFFSAPEVLRMSQASGLSVREVLAALWEAGLRTLPGGGAEVLADSVKRRISPRLPKGRSQDWLAVHREAHRLGYRTTATMMYGHVEKDEEIIEHLEQLRALQEEATGRAAGPGGSGTRGAAGPGGLGINGGFTAFVPWSYKRENTALGRRVSQEAGPNRYLRLIALSRLYLDNFPHIQASWFSEGKKTGQVALHFGADDFGGTLLEEEVMLKAGFYNRTTVEEVVALIREAGFRPAQRTTLYEVLRYC